MPAANERAMRLRIGLFVLVALGLFAGLVILFSAMPVLFVSGNKYLIRFSDAPGVTEGTPVRRSGVRVGEVRQVKLDEGTGEVIVTAYLDKDYIVRRNDVPTLHTGLIGSDTTIDFLPRPQPEGEPPLDRSPLPPDSEIVGERAATVSSLVTKASEVVPSTQEALNDVRKSLKQIEKIAPVAEEALKVYRDLGKSINESIPDLRKTNTEIQELTRAIRETVPEARKTLENINSMAPEARKTLENINATIPQARKTLENINAAIPDARKTIDDIGAASRNVGRLSERLDVMLQGNQDKVNKAIDNLSEILQRTAALLNDENIRAINATIRNTSRAAERLPDIALQAEAATKEAAETMKEGRRVLDRADGMINRLDDILKNIQEITKPLAERSSSLFRNLDEAAQKVNHTMTDVGELLKVLDQSDGTLRKFLTDPSLYIHVDEIACRLARAMPRVDEIMKNVEIFTDELARHPESLGIGGVVRPSSGLKGPPTPPLPYQH